MKKYILIGCLSFLGAQQSQTIVFDHSGQFGFQIENGGIRWNQDWRSNGLLFDGVWAVYPRQLGRKIESGIGEIRNTNPNFDSSQVTSYFTYDMGDYSLDRFSTGTLYTGQGRQIHLHGFKRSYGGHYNQYANRTHQPIQQFYLSTYASKKESEYASLSVGHGNMLSGFPDTTGSGRLSNRFISANVFWQKSLSQLDVQFSLDQFLQRYETTHSMSVFSGVRYLTRSRNALDIFWNSFQFNLSLNNRQTRMGKLIEQRWTNFGLKGSSRGFDGNLGWVIAESESDYFYQFNYEKNFGSLNGEIEFTKNVDPVHPFYLSQYNQGQNSLLTQISQKRIGLNWVGEKNSIQLSYSEMEDHHFWRNTLPDSIPNYLTISKMASINLGVQTSMIPFVTLEAKYTNQTKGTLYGGGIPYFLNYSAHSDFYLFDEFMRVELFLEMNHYFKRIQNGLLNPIEMVPSGYYSDEKMDDVSLLTGRIRTHVSTFTIQYEWINIMEMILASMGSDANKFYEIYPGMPPIGRQVNLSVEWHFLD